MGSLILPSATTALAYKRLGDVIDRLDRKVRTVTFNPEPGFAGRTRTDRRALNDAERRVLALANAARAMFEGGEAVAMPNGSAIPGGLSKFAVLGATGFEWPQAAMAGDGLESWVAATIRRGNPDPNRGAVNVPSTDFALAAGRAAIDGATSEADRAKARAFTMGLLGATANQVLVPPTLRGLHEARTDRVWSQNQPGDAIARAENRVRADFFDGLTNVGLQNWLPSPADVPDSIHQGYLDALEAIYEISDRPTGLAGYEAGFGDPGPLTVDQLRASQSLLVQQMVTATWGPGTWWLVLTPGLLAVPLSLLFGKLLPNSKHFFEEGDAGERAAYEMVTLGMGLGSLAPFGWSMYLWSQIPGHGGTFGWSLASALARIALTIGSLSTHHRDLHPAGRWGGFYGGMQLLDLIALIGGIVHAAGDRPGDAFVWFLNTFPTMVGTTSLGFAGLMKLVGLDNTEGYWASFFVLTAAFLTAVGLPVAFKLANSEGIASLFTPDPYPPLDACLGVVSANPAGSARLFDDSTLWTDPDAPDQDGLGSQRYPWRRAGLVRLWWTGTGDLTINHDGRRVQLRLDDAPLDDFTLELDQLTAANLAQQIDDAHTDITVELVDDTIADLPLAFLSALADPGDQAATLAEHEAGRQAFVEVGDSAETAHIIHAGPQSGQTTPFGTLGPTVTGLDDTPVVPQAGLGDADVSAVGLAADLAALLAMGAAPTLADAPIEPPLVDGRPVAFPAESSEVHQIFRRWNLDDRRVNEWRMLVTGGARSEKLPGSEDGHDPGMRAYDDVGVYQSLAADGRDLTDRLGWLPVWRAWLRMATDVTSDTLADQAEPYSPRFVDGTGATRQPTNAELTTAIRYLLDLP